MTDDPGPDFDIAVTFAGEEREFVEQVVQLVKAHGFTIFYDEDAKAEMWGEDLTEFFANVYERRARFAVMFISAAYASKMWTRLERRSVLERAMREGSPYLLPVRFDTTKLPGVRSTLAYLDALTEGPEGVADAVRLKLKTPLAGGDRMFNGRVPRTEEELSILLGERPSGWEYLLFSYCLQTGIDNHKPAYNDHVMRFAVAGDYVPDSEILDYQRTETAHIMSVTRMFETLLDDQTQEVAMGAPGESGDPELIEHLANRMVTIYAEIMRWAYRMRSVATDTSEGAAMLHALADYANQPIAEIRQFVGDYRANMDRLTEVVEAGGDLDQSYTIKFEIPEDVSARFDEALQAYAKTVLG